MEISNRYDIKKLRELIEDYAKHNSGSAKIELSNMIIDGEELIEALYDITGDEEELEKLEKKYEKLEGIFKKQREMFLKEKEKYNELLEEKMGNGLLNELEKILEGKIGSFAEKMKVLINKYK